MLPGIVSVIITESSRRAAREGGPFRKRRESHIVSRMSIESVVIDKDTNICDFKNELRWNEAAYK